MSNINGTVPFHGLALTHPRHKGQAISSACFLFVFTLAAELPVEYKI